IVGGFAGDRVGGHITTVSNGTYYVTTPDWNGGRGAVTWSSGLNAGPGVLNVVGAIAQTNSLIGSQAGDHVGGSFVYVDTFGTPRTFNAFIVSPDWSNGGIANVGAVTFAPGGQPITGVVGV